MTINELNRIIVQKPQKKYPSLTKRSYFLTYIPELLSIKSVIRYRNIFTEYEQVNIDNNGFNLLYFYEQGVLFTGEAVIQ